MIFFVNLFSTPFGHLINMTSQTAPAIQFETGAGTTRLCKQITLALKAYIFNPTVQEMRVSTQHENEAIGWKVQVFKCTILVNSNC